jgi:hypothetical protein
MFQEKELANHIHRSPAMPPSVPIGKECACVFIRSRVSSVENGVPKKPTRKACQPDIQESKRKEARPSKDLPKRPVSGEICVLQYNESNDRDDES